MLLEHVLQVLGIQIKKSVWFSALQHSREWVSPTTNLYILTTLLEQYRANNARVRRIFGALNFHFLPVINPDGYEFSHTNQRLWRKNRRNNTPHNSFGVDLNRNWPFAWGGQGSSSDPGSDVYHGRSPASEPEVQNIIRYFNEQRISAAIDFHSYSQLLLRPWQHTTASCPDEAGLSALGAKMATAIQQNGGKVYRNIRGSQLYVHSGGMVDFFYGTKKIWGYTFELRPGQGEPGGFILPPQFIVPTGIENYHAILDFCEKTME